MERRTLEIRSEPGAGGRRVLSLSGELDLISASPLERALRRAEAVGPAGILLDLREVTFLDSTGLQLILDAELRARRSGRLLELRRGPEAVHRVFVLTCTDEALAFVD